MAWDIIGFWVDRGIDMDLSQFTVKEPSLIGIIISYISSFLWLGMFVTFVRDKLLILLGRGN